MPIARHVGGLSRIYPALVRRPMVLFVVLKN